MMNQKLKSGKNNVSFQSDGKKLSGHLFLPKEYESNKKYPAIVITRPASGVKEQTSGIYAEKLAKKGFVTLTFDPKGYGDSEGRPQVEDPFSIISDTKNAVTYLESLPMVDSSKIVNGGVCMGAGYATAAAAEDRRIKATAAISPYLTGHIDYPKAYGGKAVVWIMMTLAKPISLLGINLYFPPVPIKNWAKKLPTLPVQLGMLQYYAPGKPGDVPNWKNQVNLAGAEKIMLGKYNPFDFVAKYSKTRKPYFYTYADGGYSPDLLQKFYDDIGSDDKELSVAKNATHFDLYYKPEYVDPIVEKIDKFFKKHL